MNKQHTSNPMNQPVPDVFHFKVYDNCIFIEAKERIEKLLNENRVDEAKAMAKEWKL